MWAHLSDNDKLKMEKCFNTLTTELLVSSSIHADNALIRLVLDDDKVHCE